MNLPQNNRPNGENNMELIKNLQDHVGSRPEKFFKDTLFRSDALLLGLNCLEPGQVQKPHDHADQDPAQSGPDAAPADLFRPTEAVAAVVVGLLDRADRHPVRRRDPVRNRDCLVVRNIKREMTADHGILAMAGLYEIWRDPAKADDEPDR